MEGIDGSARFGCDAGVALSGVTGSALGASVFFTASPFASGAGVVSADPRPSACDVFSSAWPLSISASC
ncbi:MAG: hypothetical protein A3B30_01550 [Candidatus Komeilibacteria bacterium RIFCSPLOWO2_01_FULL_52_15]|uniref:Uncharacterized protein n=1 Tax=Candidatus Komeilibacteria bacterium RIFCSPLOWO2_01_FULL_52_15 TaxID=1798551 RepID=A0A1G2BTQ0_9BACT|nr:MAG: hypothetical protein A3B30_01550 [Candidatus Komeilibacteria bacterium RIFCSPLOWO2_01_FULL_52_15]